MFWLASAISGNLIIINLNIFNDHGGILLSHKSQQNLEKR